MNNTLLEKSHRHGWKDKRIDLTEIVCENIDWIKMAKYTTGTENTIMKSRGFLGQLGNYKLQFVRQQASSNVYNAARSTDVRGTPINHVVQGRRQVSYIYSMQTYLHTLEYSTAKATECKIIERTINSGGNIEMQTLNHLSLDSDIVYFWVIKIECTNWTCTVFTRT